MNLDIIQGDCLKVLKNFPDNFLDSIVTDPPYGLSFMGKKWDYDVPSIEIWKEVLRVLKPGGHLLSFGGTRTYHRMVVNIEDAGFEIRDQIQWLYGSGFPKSMNISKALDKMAGAEREVVGTKKTNVGMQGNNYKSKSKTGVVDITASATDEAKQWDGWGTALKPANEPIVLARKPLSEKTIAQNVLKHGTGGINIDECRVETADTYSYKKCGGSSFGVGKDPDETRNYPASSNPQGRFPANIILDEAAAEMLDEQSGTLKSGVAIEPEHKKMSRNIYGETNTLGRECGFKDSGGASRFFYCAKTSKKERGEGNIHPTVKPIKLMAYLVKLITPPDGIVLDPFAGSGSTGLACKELGNFHFIGIEMNLEYVEIARARLNGTKEDSE